MGFLFSEVKKVSMNHVYVHDIIFIWDFINQRTLDLYLHLYDDWMGEVKNCNQYRPTVRGILKNLAKSRKIKKNYIKIYI